MSRGPATSVVGIWPPPIYLKRWDINKRFSRTIRINNRQAINNNKLFTSRLEKNIPLLWTIIRFRPTESSPPAATLIHGGVNLTRKRYCTCATFFPTVLLPMEVARLFSQSASANISLAEAVCPSVKSSKDTSLMGFRFLLISLSILPLSNPLESIFYRRYMECRSG